MGARQSSVKQGRMKRLYTYWRSSTAYRVRIAMNLKGLRYQSVYVSLPRLEHRTEDFMRLNPQGLVPTLDDAGFVLSQSMAILEYLDERYPTPRLLPDDLSRRAYVRMLANIIACDIHPLNNVRVLKYLKQDLAVDDAAQQQWYERWVIAGLSAFEGTLSAYRLAGRYCCGDAVSLADICLVPQIYNARRFNCPLDHYPRLREIAERCEALPEFAAAHPLAQADAQ